MGNITRTISQNSETSQGWGFHIC